ncbi:hypothetical protein WDU94_005806 [Cyamophila willieti]
MNDVISLHYKYFPSYQTAHLDQDSSTFTSNHDHPNGGGSGGGRNISKTSKHTKKLLKYKLYFDALHNLNNNNNGNSNNAATTSPPSNNTNLNFQCPNCLVKSYKYISALRRHLTYECGKDEREFICILCLKQYKRRDHLQCHIKLKHHYDMVSQNKVWQDFVKH